jgi:hypothetical protein
MSQLNGANAVASALPELLKEFSMKLQYEAKSDAQKDAAILVRDYRKYEALPLVY